MVYQAYFGKIELERNRTFYKCHQLSSQLTAIVLHIVSEENIVVIFAAQHSPKHWDIDKFLVLPENRLRDEFFCAMAAGILFG